MRRIEFASSTPYPLQWLALADPREQWQITMEQTHPGTLGLPSPAPIRQGLATAWLTLGIVALALAGLFAVLLVMARTPGLQSLFPSLDFFRTALVVHVDQSVLIWFLAFSGLLWSLGINPVGPGAALLRWTALALAMTGCLLLAAAPFVGAGAPLLNNYIPVLQHPLFYIALLLFGAGILLQAVLHLAHRLPQGLPLWCDPLAVGNVTAAMAVLLAGGSLAWSWSTLPSLWQGQAYFEYLFWGPGHVLQFAYTQIMLVAWIGLARSLQVPLRVSDGGLAALLTLGFIPLLLVPAIYGRDAVDAAATRLAFTQLMQYGNGLAVLPIGLFLLLGLRRHPPVTQDRLPEYRALLGSWLLFAAGGLLGGLIAGVNTIIPAHYHGSIVGVTLALMGMTYHLLPRLGYTHPLGRLARVQPVIYAAGQMLHISGLAASGAMGIQRKTAGAAQGLADWPSQVAMGVMGSGGLLAVIGGILFVWVVLRTLARRGPV
jgi:cytochrome c oxidase subunit I